MKTSPPPFIFDFFMPLEMVPIKCRTMFTFSYISSETCDSYQCSYIHNQNVHAHARFVTIFLTCVNKYHVGIWWQYSFPERSTMVPSQLPVLARTCGACLIRCDMFIFVCAGASFYCYVKWGGKRDMMTIFFPRKIDHGSIPAPCSSQDVWGLSDPVSYPLIPLSVPILCFGHFHTSLI
jgi:hypothetical protein